MKSITIIRGRKVYQLAKGENPYQSPADLFSTQSDDPLSLDKFRLISGDAPGFTNLCGVDRLVQILCRSCLAFKLKYNQIPYIVIAAKHGNPCGLAIDWKKPETAINKALFGNPLAIWGGEVITNFKIDDDLAAGFFSSPKRQQLLGSPSWMLDIIIAPDFSSGALKLLGARAKRKLFVNPSLSNPTLNPAKWTYRFTRGSFIRQPPQNYVLDLTKTDFVGTKKCLNQGHFDSLIIAWATAYNSNHGGNEVALAKNRALLSCGGGPSTIEAAQLAFFKAKNQKHDTRNSVFAADAFFPFTDVPEVLTKAGVMAGLVPAGGQAFEKVKACFQKSNIPMFYLDEKYRGFCYH
jgi:phosphoribosylaminoimidazolecarboxamide formyltransferase/IMP cyclohydrolase